MACHLVQPPRTLMNSIDDASTGAERRHGFVGQVYFRVRDLAHPEAEVMSEAEVSPAYERPLETDRLDIRGRVASKVPRPCVAGAHEKGRIGRNAAEMQRSWWTHQAHFLVSSP